MENLCKKIFGTEDEAELMKIAEKARKYDMILKNEYPVNVRNAGRKPSITEEQIIKIAEMKENGETVQQIADQLETTRQTIYKYLALAKKEREKNALLCA